MNIGRTILAGALALTLAAGALSGSVFGDDDSFIENKDTVKPYNYVEKIYTMDFEDTDMKTYSKSEGFFIGGASGASLDGGVLKCVAKKKFTMGTNFIPGDMYGLNDGEVSFDMELTGGTVTVTVRQTERGDTLSGISFVMTKSKIDITEASGNGKETITGLNFSGAHKISFYDNHDIITLKIDGKVVIQIKVTADSWYKVDENGEKKGSEHPHVTLPIAGYFKFTVDNMSGYFDNVTYNFNEISSKVGDANGEREINYGLWTATDDLGRETLTIEDVGAKRADKYVGLFYFICHVHTGGREIRDFTEMYLKTGLEGLKKHLETSPGGYWSEPLFGYYLSHDEYVIRKHAAMLSAADVDFIFLDMSNANVYEDVVNSLFSTFLKIRKEGGKTPDIVLMMGDMPSNSVVDLYKLKDIIFTNEEYMSLLWKWDGKPLLLANTDKPNSGTWTVSPSTPQSESDYFNAIKSAGRGVREWYESGEYDKMLDLFTIRKCWAWQNENYNGYWDWLQDSPQNPGTDADGTIRQMAVALGTHAHTGRGRSLLNNDTSYDKGMDFGFSLPTKGQGLFFAEQFNHALKADPSIIMITGWNEWYAGCYHSASQNQKTGNTPTPGYYLVDQFTPEYSRDAEPMRIRDGEFGGVGFGDNYYYQMVNFIRQYKGTGAISAGEKYMDNIGDTAYRCENSFGNKYLYINNTGRNDFDYAETLQTENDFVFKVKTVSEIVKVNDSAFMNLFINSDMKNDTGWEGFDYVLNRSRDGSTVSIERFTSNGWELENIGTASYEISGDTMTITVPKSSIGLSGEVPSILFKWADNSVTDGDPFDFYDHGDTAPDSRFAFIYSGKEVSISTPSNPSKDAPAFSLSLLIMIIGPIALIAIGVIIALVIIRKKKKVG